MKKITFFKSLLAAAMICVGGNAWAATGDVVTNAKFTFTSATISDKSVAGETGTMTWTSQWTPNPSIDSDMFRVGNMSDGVVTLVGDAAGSKDIVTITFDMGILGLTGKYAEFKVTDVNSTVLIDESFCVYSATGFESGKNTLGFAITDFVFKNATGTGMIDDIKNSFTLTLNYATKKMTGRVVNKTYDKEYTVDMPDGAGAVASFAVRSGYNNADRRCYFDNLLITTTEGDYSVTDADYTVKFVNESGVEIKDAITRSGTPGSSISATTGDKESFFNDAKTMKYFYKSDDSEGKTIASDGSTVLTITYREANTYSYTLKSSLGTTISSGSTFEGESVTVPYSIFILSGSKLYSTGASDDSGKKFSKTFTVSSDAQEETLTYSENLTDVVFYVEGENVSGATSTTIANAGVRGSNCAAGYNGTDGDIVITTLSDAGKYEITIATYGTKGSYTFNIMAGERTAVTAAYPGTNGPTYTGEFIITGSTDIIWPKTDESHAIDYIYIQKTGDAVVPVTIASSGYSTIASAYALDCANLPSGMTAYQVTATSASSVTLTEVTEAVAAGTGLILAGTASTAYDIPVVASGSNISSTNKLKAAVTATTLDDGTFYVLKGGKFCKVEGATDEAARTVPAGKAYLLASDIPAPARELSFVFDDTTTSINEELSVKNEESATAIYNLSGQRVAQPQKGLYIMNGKKVIVK